MRRRFACALTCLSVLGCAADHGAAGPETCVPPAVTAYESRVPPARSTATSAPGTTRYFAIATLQLGVTRKDTGALDPNAWKDLGFDLDARDTTFACGKATGESCSRQSGSQTATLVDGNGGIDNNFGAHAMSIFKAVRADIEQLTNQDVSSGRATWILRLDDVGGDDDAHVPGAIYLAGSLASPTFTETDHWPIVATSLEDSVSIDRPRVSFPDGYMVGGTWVSGAPTMQMLPLLPLVVLPNGDLGAAFRIDLSFGKDCPPGTYGMFCENRGDPPPPPPPPPALPPRPTALIRFPLERPILTVNVHEGRGTIAAVLRDSGVRETLAAVWPEPPSPSATFTCGAGGVILEQLVQSMTLSSDLVADAPSLQDPRVTCDAISVGLGFTMKPTGAPSGVVPDTFVPFRGYEKVETTLDDGIDNDCDGKADERD